MVHQGVGDGTGDFIHEGQIRPCQAQLGHGGVLGYLNGVANTSDGMGERSVDDPGDGQLPEGNMEPVGDGTKLGEGGLAARGVGLAEQDIVPAVVPLVEAMVRAEFPGQDALAQGRVGQYADVVFFAIGPDFPVDMPPEQGVGRLQAEDVSVARGFFQLIEAEIGDADSADLALFLESGKGFHGFMDGGGLAAPTAAWPVDLIKVQIIGAEIPEGSMTGFEYLGRAQMVGGDLGEDHRFLAPAGERLAQ